MPHTVAGQDSHPGEGCGSFQRHRPERLLGSSITYRVAVGPQARRVVFTQQNLPVCDEPCWTQLKWPLIFIVPLAVIRFSPIIRSR